MTPEANAGRIHVSDIEELNYSVWPWNLPMRQLSCGESRADLDFAEVHDIFLSRPTICRKKGSDRPLFVDREAPAPIAHKGPLPHHGEVEPGRDPGEAGHFAPPARGEKSEKELGEMVALGEASSCTLTATRSPASTSVTTRFARAVTWTPADSAPMWASWVAYPAYRKKTTAVNTMIERVQGCFKDSMNAQPPRSATCPPPRAARSMP
jgi:hypothetical protein